MEKEAGVWYGGGLACLQGLTNGGGSHSVAHCPAFWKYDVHELICEKHGERMPVAGAACRHPGDYCRHRRACMIHYLETEAAAQDPAGVAPDGQDEERGAMKLDFGKGGGLVPAIVQDAVTGQVLMLAYMNDQAWSMTLATGKAHYWSRSRNRIWLKGETSGHVQLVRSIHVDCDADTVVLRVDQQGGAACHEGYRTCFFRKVETDGTWTVDGERVFNPSEVYGK